MVDLGGLHAGPVLVDRGMRDALAPAVSACVAVVPSTAARARGRRGMRVPPTELAQASCLPRVAAHRDVAEPLALVITRLP